MGFNVKQETASDTRYSRRVPIPNQVYKKILFFSPDNDM